MFDKTTAHVYSCDLLQELIAMKEPSHKKTFSGKIALVLDMNTSLFSKLNPSQVTLQIVTSKYYFSKTFIAFANNDLATQLYIKAITFLKAS